MMRRIPLAGALQLLATTGFLCVFLLAGPARAGNRVYVATGPVIYQPAPALGYYGGFSQAVAPIPAPPPAPPALTVYTTQVLTPLPATTATIVPAPLRAVPARPVVWVAPRSGRPVYWVVPGRPVRFR